MDHATAANHHANKYHQGKRLRIIVLGGNLQGVEAAYLAQKAGWESVVIDRNPACPAAGLCDGFIAADIQARDDLNRHLENADMLLPATENPETLACLHRISSGINMPVLFDFSAYTVSSSKKASNRLFDQSDIPMPKPWPACGFPVIAKPNFGSGSQGVRVYQDAAQLAADEIRWNRQPVMQQFIPGPLFSVEVIGDSKTFVALPTTELEIDRWYDCKRVIAPAALPQKYVHELESMAAGLASSLSLRGVMDLEVVFHDNTLNGLEIDARLPSQTPTAVWWSTGLNQLQLLARCFLSGENQKKPVATRSNGVVYEHIRVKAKRLEVAGEHIMSQTDSLSLEQNFFGADEALTNYQPQRSEWVATLINTGQTRQAAWAKRNRVVADIQRHFGLESYVDSVPEYLGKNTC
jgi:pyrrolysine biosynthesis protein PylC